MSETREALAPCPFCGCKARILETQTDVVVACEGCCVENHFINDIRDTGRSRAIAAWNRRALSVRDERAEERGWMPIETAPTDGSKFDAWCVWPSTGGSGGRFTDVQMRGDGTGFGYVYHTESGAKWVYLEQGDDIFPPWKPTHWRDKPAPPAAIRAGGTDGH